MIKHLSQQNEFENEIKDGLVLIDFYATWCGPCSMLAPVLEELDKEMDIKIIKIDVDELPDLAQQFRIMSIPALMLFKDGKFVKQQLGYMPLNHLKNFVTI